MEADDKGRVRLSMKALIEPPAKASRSEQAAEVPVGDAPAQ
jgi:hypothetical protein